MFNRCAGTALLIGLALAAAPAQAQTQAPTHSFRHGLLTCQTSASIGLIIGSRQQLRCQFKTSTGQIQNYIGTIGRIGLDLGITAGGIMQWAVFGSSANIPSGALTGRFVGVSGDISLGVGVGANLLVGGTYKSISLQPLSVEGQVGVNLALGAAGMTLNPVR
jgi:hypothetical protein